MIVNKLKFPADDMGGIGIPASQKQGEEEEFFHFEIEPDSNLVYLKSNGKSKLFNFGLSWKMRTGK